MVKHCDGNNCDRILEVGSHENPTTKALSHNWGVNHAGGVLWLYCPACNRERIARQYGEETCGMARNGRPTTAR